MTADRSEDRLSELDALAEAHGMDRADDFMLGALAAKVTDEVWAECLETVRLTLASVSKGRP